MKTIRDQINIFLEVAKLPATRLSKESGVNSVYISRLRSGKQKDTFSQKADALRQAMYRLNFAAARAALEE